MTSIRTRERQRWKLMISRCHIPGGLGYQRYGARGIRVCNRWHDFELYFADIMQLLGPCPEGCSLDRYPDKGGNYEPGNVRWATASEQQQNSCQYKRWWPRADEAATS
jgi:hypothetical protein